MEFEKAYYLLLHAKKIISDIEVEYAKHGVEWCEPNSVIINHMIDAENAIAKAISGMNDQIHDSEGVKKWFESLAKDLKETKRSVKRNEV